MNFFQTKLSVDINKCNLCQACVLLCPHHCLAIKEDKNAGQINFSDKKCNPSCTKCREICKLSAIEITRKISVLAFFKPWQKKWLVAHSLCENCGVSLSSWHKQGELCISCRKKRTAGQLVEESKVLNSRGAVFIS